MMGVEAANHIVSGEKELVFYSSLVGITRIMRTEL